MKIEPIHCDSMIPDETLLWRVVEATEQGAQVAIVCNLVDVAQRLVRALRKLTGLPVDLFHARYCYIHRQRKEKRAIMRFGPKGKRRTGRVLVATQVVEQSLDLDFDWLITQLCPVDLLFQRMGRLHRHERAGRPAGFETPLCSVLLPLGEGYGLHGHIYANTRLLWRTAKMLNGTEDGTVVFPKAYRSWIERVYRDEAWFNEPSEVTAGYDKFVSDVEDIKKFKADYMVRSAINPFNDTEDAVLAVTRDGEMNLSVVPFCSTSRGKMLMDGSIFEELDEKQRIEVLTLNTVGVPKSWRQHLEDSEEGRYWLELQQEGNGYRGHSKGVTFRYHQDTGLEKET